MNTSAKIRRVVLLLFSLTESDYLSNVVNAGNLRSLGDERATASTGGHDEFRFSSMWERILSSHVEPADHFLHNGRMRHRKYPKERNIFDKETPSSVPSSAPSDESSFSETTVAPQPTAEPQPPGPPGPPDSNNGTGGSEPGTVPAPGPAPGPTGEPGSIPAPAPGPAPGPAPPPGSPNNDVTASSIDDFLSQTMSNAVNTLGSPQNKALLAIQSSSPSLDPNNPDDQIEILQRYALNTLYFVTQGEDWISNDFWTSANHPCGTINAKEEIEGTWFGIDCDPERKIVEKISLQGNGLNGFGLGLPSDIRALSGLIRLDVNNNQLGGPLTESIGALTNLSVLDIGNNFFTGNLPQSIGNLQSLLMLDISNNFLSGTVLDEISQLTSLLGISAESNFFKGTLSPELFEIKRLVTLTLDNNEFAGTVPNEIGQLTAAKSLSFSSNSLTGTIPSEIRALENIETFDVSSNYLSDKLPDIFDELVYLKDFDVSLNYLSGTLPPTLLNSANVLNSLNMSGNVFGVELSLPEDLGSMTSLTSLDLSTNQFLGSIPESIGDLKNLVELRLDRNFLTGALPVSLKQLTNMKRFSAAGNSITRVPPGLTRLTMLEELQLSLNNIEEVPQEIFNDLPNMVMLNISRNELNGNSFPDQFTSTALTTLDVGHSSVGPGFDISSLLGLSNIENLHFASCSIQSSLPDNISILQSLVTLDFGDNVMGGTLPPSLGEIDSLETILLGDNLLTGTIPASLASLPNFKVLELQSNLLSGTIPSDLASNTNLRLDVSGNYI